MPTTPMKSSVALTALSACPVCGQRLSSTDFVCTECGAILAVRAARAYAPSTADRVKSRLIGVYHRGFSALTSAVPKLLQGRRRSFHVVVALLAAVILVVAIAGILGRPNSRVDSGSRNLPERPETGRAAIAARQGQPQRPEEPPQTAVPSKSSQIRAAYGGSAALGMVGATVLAALLCIFAVKSERRRRQDGSAGQAGHVRAGHMIHAASVGAAFCFGLAVALAIVLITQSRAVSPLPMPAVVEGEHVNQWRRETSTPKERLSGLDARLASLESTRPGEGARQQPSRTAAIDRAQRDAAVTAAGRRAPRNEAVGGHESAAVPSAPAATQLEASVKPPAADILRARGVRAYPTVADRVLDDVWRDWESVRRSIRDLFPRASR